MAEYIDKQALIEGMVKVDGRKWSTKTLGEVLDAIGHIDIVRCKDCRLSDGYYGECPMEFIDPEGFCHKGEKREE